MTAISTTARVLATIAVLFASACGGGKPQPEIELHGSTMGTTYTISIISPRAEFTSQATADDINNELDRIEDLVSTFRAKSELSTFNQNTSTEWISVSRELCDMISSALLLGQQTGGAFDVTIGPLVNLWGFGPADFENAMPSAQDIARARNDVGQSNLHSDCKRSAVRKASPAVFVDLSGWAKGYAVDRIAAILNEAHLENFLVEIGGELRASGHNANSEWFKIGLEDPVPGRSKPTTAIRVRNSSVATSGDYRNFFEHHGKRYSHTIDPRTGWPIDHTLAAVTVVAESAAFSDGMATGLLVLGLDVGLELAEKNNIAALFVSRTADGFEYTPSKAFLPLLER